MITSWMVVASLLFGSAVQTSTAGLWIGGSEVGLEEGQSAELRITLGVAEEELAAGHGGTACAGFQQALRLDPASERARLGRLASCAGAGTSVQAEDFDRVAELVEGEDYARALELIEQLEPKASGELRAGLSLLAGICQHALGAEVQAERRLKEAERSVELGPDARLMQAALAIDAGRAELAELLLDALPREGDGPEQRAASDLLRMVRRGHRARLALAVALDAAFDSNPGLVPSSDAALVGTPLRGADGALRGEALAIYRPFREPGPYLRASLSAQQQLLLPSLDYVEASAALGLKLGRADRWLNLEYSYHRAMLGGTEYLSANDLDARGGWSTERWSISGTWLGRLGHYFPIASGGYSGFFQAAELEFDWHLSPSLRAGLVGSLSQHAAQDSTLRHFGFGGGVLCSGRVSGDLRLFGSVRALRRLYDPSSAPVGGDARQDLELEALAGVELATGDRWIWTASLIGYRALSSDPFFDHTRVLVALGVRWATDVF